MSEGKFYIIDNERNGVLQAGINHEYYGDPDGVSVQDLLIFLDEQGLDPADMKLGTSCLFFRGKFAT